MAGETTVEYMVVEEKYSYLPRFDTCYGPAHMIGHVVFGLDKDKFRARMKKYGLLLLVFSTISSGAMFLAMAGKLPPWALLPSAFGSMVLPSLMLLYANIHLARLIVFSSIEFWFLQALFALFIVSFCDMFKWDLRCVGMLSCWLVQTVVMLIEASNPPKLRISKTKVTGLIVVLCGYLAWFAMSMGGFFEDVRVRDVVLSIGGQRFTINNVVFGNQRLATCGVFVCKYLFHAITSPGTFISFTARIKLNGCSEDEYKDNVNRNYKRGERRVTTDLKMYAPP
ncbi:hypothetical protein TeGR_g3415 [Tetraparma gracilis]|uniref:Uncharacterized protein n=1 Tax=Tetraparma gracilis TaxID=2962635 RepID=A0ABQ6N0X7_9STRA|nr:hypothetical protein TeGR_g3415 [Tetraparma gracilis]